VSLPSAGIDPRYTRQASVAAAPSASQDTASDVSTPGGEEETQVGGEVTVADTDDSEALWKPVDSEIPNLRPKHVGKAELEPNHSTYFLCESNDAEGPPHRPRCAPVASLSHLTGQDPPLPLLP
jgi:hypothetical protein